MYSIDSSLGQFGRAQGLVALTGIFDVPFPLISFSGCTRKNLTKYVHSNKSGENKSHISSFGRDEEYSNLSIDRVKKL